MFSADGKYVSYMLSIAAQDFVTRLWMDAWDEMGQVVKPLFSNDNRTTDDKTSISEAPGDDCE
jgi:hypothetical protein